MKEMFLKKAEGLISALLKGNDDTASREKLTALIQQDLAIRSRAIDQFGLSLAAELFIFGRPVFKILSARGFQFTNKIAG
jgi:hypothetical protein